MGRGGGAGGVHGEPAWADLRRWPPPPAAAAAAVEGAAGGAGGGAVLSPPSRPGRDDARARELLKSVDVFSS